MKNRSVSQRNFVGAFLGGVLGILACGYLHPAVLPFGCFLGVIIGWWYQEIWQSVTDSVNHAVARVEHTWNQFTIFVLTPTWKLKNIKIDIKIKPCLKVLHSIIFPLIWLLLRPIAIIKWLMKHQVNRLYITRTLAVFTHSTINALWVVPLVIYNFKAIELYESSESLIPVLHCMSMIFVPLFTMILPLVALLNETDEETLKKMRRFYLNWERYVEKGSFRFYAKELSRFFLYEISICSLFIGGAAWFTVIGAVFVLIVVVPISAGIGLVKGIYKVSVKAGHWLCFGTTVTVTAFVAWTMHPYLNDVRILWFTALFAGLLSAALTEALRRSLVWSFSINERARLIALTRLYVQLTPSGRKFWQITTNIGDRFCDILPI
jgi:hypothetical protein